MNKSRRKRIANIISNLEGMTEYNVIESIKEEIEEVLWEEDDAYNNMPENLQYSMRGEESYNAIDNLQEAVDVLEEVLDILNEINNLNENYNDSDEEERLDLEDEIELKESEVDDCVYQAVGNLEQII